MTNITEIVAKQYTDWSYPEPVEDMAAKIIDGYYEYGAPNIFRPLLWPERLNVKTLNVLIAGCGTNQAAYAALTLPNAKVTAIDLSMSSLQHGQYLKKKHGLENLTLQQMSLLDVGELGQTYDYIACTGVLHHMADPDAGLRALRDVLNADGVINAMVYGRYLRLGVYMMQEVFKRLGCGQTQQDVDLVKATIASLPDRHHLHAYVKAADDLQFDAGIVDTFLHPQDRAFTVPEIFSFANNNGLAFFDWEDRLDYSAMANISPEHPIHQRLQTLPKEEQWAIVELLSQARGVHRFFLCHPERAKRVKVSFESQSWQRFVPVLRHKLTVLEQGDFATNKPAKLKRLWSEFSLNQISMALMQQVNSQRMISEIIELAALDAPELTVDDAREFFRTMQDLGHVMYWLEPEGRNYSV